MSFSVVRNLNRFTQVRSFTKVSFVAQQGLIKDLYIKEIKSYKPSANANTSDVVQVKEFKLPTPPQAPKFDEDVSSELAKYDQ